MRNKNSENENARSGRAVTDDQPAQDGAHVMNRGEEPRSYVAPDYRDATLSGPAAGEVTDFYDEGDASGGSQQGRNRNNVPHMKDSDVQGAKTRRRNQEILKGQ